MSESIPSDASSDDPLQSLIADFLDAEGRGEPLDREAWLAQHAAHADSLKDFLRNHDRMKRSAPISVDDATRPAASLAQNNVTLPPSEDAAMQSRAPAVGDRLRYFGDYELLEEIARGGMGVVYKARQINLNRIVALKMILSGHLASEQDIQRFRTEAESAANLDHPRIVPIYEVGQYAGQHYFSMGFVSGKSLAQKLVDGPMAPREAAEMMVKICEGIAYAHERGVIHRDLKPANILLDQNEQPKVTDFGLAKKLGSDSNLTGTGQILGTPSYMAPEQASGKVDEVGPLADVYALGAILYCLLTGRPPFQAANPMDTLIQVLEKEPIPPRQLNTTIPVDLETICVKCLSKEPHRRYSDAKELAQELGRFLGGEPILARPVGKLEQSWRWCKRNRVISGLAASMLAILTLSTIVSASLAYWAIHESENSKRAAVELGIEKERALTAAKEERMAKLEAEAERLEAERNLTFAKKGNEILGSVFTGLDPQQIAESGLPLQDILRENLVKAVAELEGSAIGDPLEVAAMQDTLGLSLLGLGEAEQAIFVLEKARKTRRTELGLEHTDTLVTMHNLVRAYLDAGKPDLALPLSEETLKLKLAKYGADHPDTIASMNNLALSYQAAGKLDLALGLSEEILKLNKAKPGADHPSTLLQMNNLATSYLAAGRPDKALPLLEEALKLRKAVLGPDHPHTLNSMNNLATAYESAGKIDLALPLHEETVKLMTAKLGPEHPRTLTSMGNLATAYGSAGKMDLALPLNEATLKHITAKLGPEHPNTLTAMNNLAVCYWTLKQLDKSVPLFEEVLSIQEKKFGRDHPATLWSVANLGVNYRDADRLTDAIPLLEEAYGASQKIPKLKSFGSHLLNAYEKAGETAKFAGLLKDLLADARKTLPNDSPQLAWQMAQSGMHLLGNGEFAEAESLLRECLAIREKVEPDQWPNFNIMSMLGGALLGQKKFADAESLLLKGYEGLKARENTIPPKGRPRIAESLERLIDLYINWHADEPDKGYDAKAAEWQKKLDDHITANAKSN